MRVETLPLEANGHLISRKSQVKVLRPFDGEKPLILSAEYCCAVCGAWPTFAITKDTVRVQEPCPYPDGITTTITLAVPSGKLLVTDDLRPVYDWNDESFASYNTALGKAQAIEAMAAIGCAYGPTSNCGLGLYRTGPDSYIIATASLDEADNPSPPDSACLASICTDLWAYSCADFEHWKARGGDPGTLDWSDTVVDVAPGTYRFIHHSGERGFDRDAIGTVIWAHVERIT
ncbi:hypothetical protein GCM10010156_49780 [Planobispora rosea]|uniref:Uncharacterized protein n=1 Tax=Planobispora rosea TaxID=35762 RepID=A0A8J3S459_PLARO|nr:hypothetical protein [Planobispora rosea]GGS85211.1 hypothetical protein GCM10010156_49780 [Planobispora rosea]GIH86489.1 hypothetical protein Pro02_48970 [Planobispora rosea]